MKCVHTDMFGSWWLTGCPDCDLPLLVEVPVRADDRLVWRLDDENAPWIEYCPRCQLPLPALAVGEGGRPQHALEGRAAA